MARYDLGLSDEEFGELTPGEFQALCRRRNVGIKYDRYANAQVAAAIYNVNRSSNDDPVVSAFDFVRDEQQAAKRDRVLKAKRFINRAIGSMPMMTPKEKIVEIRGKVIKDLLADGYTDAEAIVNEMYPHLKDK